MQFSSLSLVSSVSSVYSTSFIQGLLETAQPAQSLDSPVTTHQFGLHDAAKAAHDFLTSISLTPRQFKQQNSVEQTAYNFRCETPRQIRFENFSGRVLELTSHAKIVSFGEMHDFNIDQSFSQILEAQEIIISLFYIVCCHNVPFPEACQIFMGYYGPTSLEPLSPVMTALLFATNTDLCHMHPSRFFAIHILPTLKAHGFTHLVLEGLFTTNPAKQIQRTKDKVGSLLIMLMSMLTDIKVESAYHENPFYFGTNVAQALQQKIDALLEENPEARIITYNGAAHNMTVPFDKTVDSPLGFEVDLRLLSFGHVYRQRFGRDYVAIDLLPPAQHQAQHDLCCSSHFGFMQQRSVADHIVEILHSDDQYAFVFPH